MGRLAVPGGHDEGSHVMLRIRHLGLCRVPVRVGGQGGVHSIVRTLYEVHQGDDHGDMEVQTHFWASGRLLLEALLAYHIRHGFVQEHGLQEYRVACSLRARLTYFVQAHFIRIHLGSHPFVSVLYSFYYSVQ